MSHRRPFGKAFYPALATGILALAIGGASASAGAGRGSAGDGASAQMASARAHASKQLTGKQIKDGSIAAADLSAAVRRKLNKVGTPGPAGPQGAPGPAGPAGGSGAAAGPAAQKLSFKGNQGAGLQVIYQSNGLKLEADCTSAFQLRIRASTAGNITHAFAVGAGGVSYSSFNGNTSLNDFIELVPVNEPIVSGQAQWASTDGTNLTISYLAAYGTGQGDCVFTGTVVKA